MLDYEGIQYKIEYVDFWNDRKHTKTVDTEEEAIEFIKDNRDGWKNYRLLKTTYAIIDF